MNFLICLILFTMFVDSIADKIFAVLIICSILEILSYPARRPRPLYVGDELPSARRAENNLTS